jgi:hypothetical protein
MCIRNGAICIALALALLVIGASLAPKKDQEPGAQIWKVDAKSWSSQGSLQHPIPEIRKTRPETEAWWRAELPENSKSSSLFAELLGANPRHSGAFFQRPEIA